MLKKLLATNYMKKGVQDYIIHKLQEGESVTPDLVLHTSHACNVSSQAVYKILTKLRKDEVVTISKQRTSLSLLYIEKEKERWQFAYRLATSGKELLQVVHEKRNKIIYTFNNLREFDLFWTHSFTILSSNIPTTIPRYMITPHDFFLYARPETDSFWIKKNVTDNHVSRLVIPYALSLDKEVLKKRKHVSGTHFEFLVGKNPLGQKEHVYYNLLGDYIFTGTLDTKINEEIIHFITNTPHIPQSTKDLTTIQKIIETKGRFTLTIERNKKKAEQMEKKLKKYFE